MIPSAFYKVHDMTGQLTQRIKSAVLLGIATVGLVSLVGCGKAEETMLPVEGQVQLDGKPMQKGTVILHPDVAKNNATQHGPRASIDANGRYKIITHPREGAPPGWYKVAVIATEPSDPANLYSLPRSLIPERFGKPDESNLAIEVRDGAPVGAYDLNLK